jgi:hypothetical protein
MAEPTAVQRRRQHCRDGVDAPCSPASVWPSVVVEENATRRGSVRDAGYHDRIGSRQARVSSARSECQWSYAVKWVMPVWEGGVSWRLRDCQHLPKERYAMEEDYHRGGFASGRFGRWSTDGAGARRRAADACRGAEGGGGPLSRSSPLSSFRMDAATLRLFMRGGRG